MRDPGIPLPNGAEMTDDEDDHPRCVVIECGSRVCRAGFAGDNAPRTVFKSVARNRKPVRRGSLGGFGVSNYDMQRMGAKSSIVCDAVGDDSILSNYSLFDLKYPIEHGIITNWDAMEKIWHHAFYKLNLDEPGTADTPVLLAEPPLNPKHIRERMTQIMFETYNVPKLYIATHAVLSLFASGRTTGIVLDSGYSRTTAVSIYEGYVLPHSIARTHFGGKDLTGTMKNLLYERGLLRDDTYSQRTSQILVRNAKEKLCRVSLDFEQEMNKAADEWGNMKHGESDTPTGGCISTTLPNRDCIRITLGNEQIAIPEMLFQPSIINCQYNTIDGIQTIVYKSIMSCNVDLRKELFSNIVLSGGNCMFPGIAKRLQKELISLTSDQKWSTSINVVGATTFFEYRTKVRVALLSAKHPRMGKHSSLKKIPWFLLRRILCFRGIDQQEYGGSAKCATWIGGSMLAPLLTIQKMWITKNEFDEAGAKVVHRKCF